ncbi:hypothetical protein EYF80_063929 [Liparis tanakae]|uniref:Uncharacterized protein n=1 Tax=Liparis tanakae TaxID=230148 RepID=A0A4Z2EB11_9TELE|nr:hypothetical protein EYF80_063929 [Liparis tanakae]
MSPESCPVALLRKSSAVGSCRPAFDSTTCVSIQLLDGRPAGGEERSVEVIEAFLFRHSVGMLSRRSPVLTIQGLM